ncbi:T9SS type A sorting domain-containing protein [Lentimicrobium sp. S6]|uniref:T9SS type A sorting domain-containing protein n=1 Tax=Lentimicrobium sp. S6 TaxID=2735872 RepID=UPI00155594D6|nr:T9SS type A sorting domain-containing protein [Lentimicrobium sp. S6]NPD47757.1 T9SS type A sorting domain-containing protein [Lentimicrobium sp. S6]
MKNLYLFSFITLFCILMNTFLTAQPMPMTYFQYSGNDTWANDIDGDNIVGNTFISSPMAVYGFKTANDGNSFVLLNYPGENYTYPQGIDGSNIVGYYKDNSAVSHGFRYNGSTWTTLDHTSGNETEMMGVSGNNYVGYYKDGDSHYHGCLYNSGTGTWTTIDRPGALNTKFTGIYGNIIVGNSGDTYSNVNTGFMYNMSTDTWTSIDYGVDGDPNSPQMTWYESTNIEGIDATHVLAYYETSGSYKVNFLYEISSGNFSLLNYDETGGKQACGIDGTDNIVGYSEGGGVYAYHYREIDPPTVITQAVSSIDATTATGNGNITNLGDAVVTQHGVCWNTSGTPTTDDSKTTEGTASSTGTFTSSITGLIENQTYYVRAYATNSGGTSYGSQVSFTAVTSVTETWTIELSDSYGDGWNGGSINVLINSSPVLSNLTLASGSGPQINEFSVSCDDIITTQYTAGSYSYENEYQIKNSNGVVEAQSGQGGAVPENISYTYDCPETPGTVSTQSVSDISTTTATGNGNITSIGTTSISAHGVCWNTSGNPTTGDSSTDEGSAGSTGTFTSDITGLSPGTTYYVKAFITDETGTIYGDQVSFTTSYLVTTQAVSDITGTTATGNGNIQTVASPITAHGVCWSTSGNPTIANSHTDEGSTSSTGAFSSSISNLTSSTTYYVRAYITNGNGTFYGNQVSFETSFVSLFDGSGTSIDPYVIADLTDLKNFSENSSYWNKYFIQTADIDASASSGWNGGEGLSAISFSGSYNGQYHTITGLYINKEIYGRAFFTTTNGASISNLGLVNVDFTCWGNVGAFVGSSSGNTTISNCFASGSVTGNYTNAGGFVGYVGNGTLTINNCYSRVSTHGESFSGGLVGRAQATINISNSYNSGAVTNGGDPGDYAGGLFAYNYYSWGDYNTITDCFWDTETSGQSTSFDDGTGLTTSEMKTQSTFTASGWDFTNTWQMDNYTNDGYPFLKWQGGTYAWSGATNNDWNTSTNWEGGEVPSTLIDNVLIPNVSNDPVISSSGTGSCKNLTINNGAILTVNSGGSLITAETITNNGTINIEKTITNDTWHLFGSPISSATANYFTGNFLQNWNESNASWSEITDQASSLTPGRGYGVYTTSKASLAFTGTPNTGNVSVSISYTSVQDSTRDGANLLGNPYPSSIDWDEVSGFGSVYYWDGDEYLAYPQTGSYGTGSRYVPPMQGFFIVVPDGDPSTFTFTNAMRTHSGATSYYKSDKSLQNGVLLSAKSGYRDDLLLIRYHPEASQVFDFDRDALKLKAYISGKSEIWSFAGNDELSIDVRNDIERIPLGYKNNLNGNYNIEVKEIGNIGSVELEDTKLNKFHNLAASPYHFDWKTTDSEERFILHLKATGTEELVVQDVQVYTANGQVYVRMDDAEEFDEIMVYDLAGRLVYENNLSKQNLQSFDLSHLQGAYLVQLVSSNGTLVEKVILE